MTKKTRKAAKPPKPAIPTNRAKAAKQDSRTKRIKPAKPAGKTYVIFGTTNTPSRARQDSRPIPTCWQRPPKPCVCD